MESFYFLYETFSKYSLGISHDTMMIQYCVLPNFNIGETNLKCIVSIYHKLVKNWPSMRGGTQKLLRPVLFVEFTLLGN